ncbi:MAG: IclR family transcriptional regulator, partial [Burkholderiales bacterium]|nr:IclR family transcriptional regulator [Burkholderiales bacterium]
MDKTAVKVLRVFEYMCGQDSPLGVSTIAGKMHLTKSNVHRILRTLVSLDYVEQLDSGLYRPTLKVWELGTLIVSRQDFLQVAKPHLRALNQLTGESIYLATLNGSEVVYLDVLDSKFPIRINAAIGGTAPPHASASGRLLLAYNPAFAEKYLEKALEKYTVKTLVRLPEVKRRLESIRQAGYSINDGEWREGVCGVAAPIHNAHQLGVAAIGITTLKERAGKQAMKRFTTMLRDVALRISRELGYRG